MTAAPPPADARRWATPRQLASTAALGAACVVVAAVLWPSSPAVILAPGERVAIAGLLGLAAAGVAGVAGAIGGPRRVARIGAVLLPLALLALLLEAPRVGRLHPRIDSRWLDAAPWVVLAAAGLLRSRLAPAVVAALALGAGVLGVGGVQARRAPVARPALTDAPDVWLITLDTVRADHLAPFGGDVPTAHTPHLDRFAAEARVFRSAFAPMALTGPSHASMFTGLEPLDHGQLRNGDPVDGDVPWLPALLRDAGYRTRGLVSAAVLDATLGFDRGFDAYDSAVDRRWIRGHGLLRFLGFRPRAGSPAQRPGDATVDLLAALPTSAGPTFTWVHLYDAHWPYTPSKAAARRVGLSDATPLGPSFGLRVPVPRDTPPPGDVVERGKQLYRAELEDLDRVVGRLLALVGDDAVVLIAGDHGESLDEHAYYLTHGRLPYAPDLRTPLMLRAPGLRPGVEDGLASVMDVAPTVLRAAGVPVPSGWAGRDLQEPTPDRVLFGYGLMGPTPTRPEFRKPQFGRYASLAARRGDRTVAWTRWQEPAAHERATDPRELVPLPLGPDDEELLERLRARAQQLPVDAPPLDPATEEALRALGYVDPH